MKELAAKYSAAQVEDKWYAYWLDHKFFHSEPNGTSGMPIGWTISSSTVNLMKNSLIQ